VIQLQRAATDEAVGVDGGDLGVALDLLRGGLRGLRR
jgi:hypothetical protein